MKRVSTCCLVLLLVAPVGVVAAPSPADGGELLIVDCLLPGQIRQLGRRSVYVSARRPLRTSARDCEIRGGEYVRHDRADYRTALTAWLPAAREGDVEAQVHVGTIFEQGLGVAPDYGAAFDWYARAAESGHTGAQLKMAHLYELGLGVARDTERSLAWYARAAGLDGQDMALVPPLVSAAPDHAAQSLTRELLALRRDNEVLRQRLGDVRDAGRSGGAESTSLREELNARSAELAALERRLETAHDAYARAVEGEGAAREAMARERERAESLAARLTGLEALPAQLAQREAAVAGQRDRIDALTRRIGELELHLEAAAAQASASRSAAAERRLAGPSLTMIDPVLPSTRGLVRVTVPEASRRVIGRVEAPAGLLALSVNEAALQPNASGVFMAEVPVRGATRVHVTAVDQQGKRQDLTFELQPGSAAAPAPPPDASVGADIYRDISFGRYHALVIGNDDYRELPQLRTAVRDAQRVSEVLELRYGFAVTKLLNADRYAILSALNDLRERLTPEDNLLVYYAGHGELDEINMRGHWLPVDAGAENTANWISNVAVTDILNVMRAGHVLLVVDSCYSGSLTRASTTRLSTPMTAEEESNWIRTMVGKRGRLVLSSGGLAPVLDAGGGEHSVFARALLEVLERNQALLDGRGLYEAVAARVAYAAANIRFEQVPEFGPIRHAGHEAGAFFLVPRSWQAAR